MKRTSSTDNNKQERKKEKKKKKTAQHLRQHLYRAKEAWLEEQNKLTKSV